ncbi:MAG: NAD(P)-dependent oxidoreductase [Pseudomonadota bacterium]
MRILVTGATGFFGSHIVPALLSCGHEVTVLLRDERRLRTYDWAVNVRAFFHDMLDDRPAPAFSDLGRPDCLIHLAWPGLPNYKEPFHVEENLPASYALISQLVSQGLRHVIVGGTCLEYGMREGCLEEDFPTAPVIAYAMAKDQLRKKLEVLKAEKQFTLQWGRIFYIYGPGQSNKSLLSQLDAAIDSEQAFFNMSLGEQLRDYLPVETAASYMEKLATTPSCEGIVNICSGSPISIKAIVERRIAERKSFIKPNFGYYPYTDYEPLAFWGCTKKLDDYLGKNHE